MEEVENIGLQYFPSLGNGQRNEEALNLFDTSFRRPRRVPLSNSSTLITPKNNHNKSCFNHVPIEPSRLIYHFLKFDSSTSLLAKVSGNTKREVGRVVPVLHIATAEQSKWEKC